MKMFEDPKKDFLISKPGIISVGKNNLRAWEKKAPFSPLL